MKPLLVFTGGHHNSALVVASAAKKEGFWVAWIGHKFASRDKSVSAEYQEVTRAGIPFYELKTGRFYRQRNPLEFLKIAFGFLQAFFYLLKLRPQLIVSFGGYLAVPVVIAGWFLGIKSLTHEQTVTAGWANRAITPFVKKILLTHRNSAKNYPSGKTVLVGLPVKPELFQRNLKKTYRPPLLFVICGKQGSHLINQALFPLIPQLIKKFTVIHQTGANTLLKDVERARRLKESLGEDAARYQFAPYFFAKDTAGYLQSAKIVVSRAGAHITYELMLLQKRAVFVPIAWVSHNEQLLNARLAIKHLPGVILEEKDLTPDSLAQALDQVVKQKTKPTADLPTDAVNRILTIIHGYLPA